MSLKEEIQEALSEIGEVYYGAGKFNDRNDWNCIVFGRRNIQTDSGRSSRQNWFVAIVNEEYVPDETIKSVTEKMRSLLLKQKGDTSVTFEYVHTSSEVLVEIAVLEFYKAEKGC